MSSMSGFCNGPEETLFEYPLSGYRLSSASDVRMAFWAQCEVVACATKNPEYLVYWPSFMNKCHQMRNWAYYLRVCVCVCLCECVKDVCVKEEPRNSPEGAVMIL